MSNCMGKILDELHRIGLETSSDWVEKSIDQYFEGMENETKEHFIGSILGSLAYTTDIPGIYLNDKELFKKEMGLSKDFGEITSYFFDFLIIEYAATKDPYIVSFDYTNMRQKILKDGKLNLEGGSEEFKEKITEFQLKTIFKKENQVLDFLKLLSKESVPVRREIIANKEFIQFQKNLIKILSDEFDRHIKI